MGTDKYIIGYWQLMNRREFETIRFLTRGRIAEIILNRPEVHNSVNYQMTADIAEALKLCKDDSIKVVVLRGEGKSFCSGADIRAFVEMHHQPENLQNSLKSSIMAS